MADLISVCFFLASSPKRQQYFEKFIDFHKELFKVSETNRTHIIGLSKKRWVERHKVSCFWILADIKFYSDFYAHLETEISEKWFWYLESQSKAQGLFSSCRRFDRLVVMENFIYSLENRMADRKNTEIFNLHPSVCLSEHFSLDTFAEELIKHFGDGLECKIPTISKRI